MTLTLTSSSEGEGGGDRRHRRAKSYVPAWPEVKLSPTEELAQAAALPSPPESWAVQTNVNGREGAHVEEGANGGCDSGVEGGHGIRHRG